MEISEVSPIWEKFNEKDNLIKEYTYWKLLVRKNHVYLGSCVVVTKKYLENFSDMSEEEIVEYLQIVRDVEFALKKLWNYDVIHHIMLMFKDKHTHFHILPRYREPRNFAGIEWIDEFMSNPLGKKREISQEVLNQIRDEIKKTIEVKKNGD
ncbi:HIT family protein [Candidatus Pacearchaeota archaeon]|nr:HIT family protein [Candidatus Pacearchaeota archaeon]